MAAPEPTAPAVEPETPAEAAPAEPEAPGATPEPSSVETPEAKNLRLKLPESDKVGRTAAAYQQRNPDWTLKECIAAAERQLGIESTPAPKPEAPKADQNGFPTTIEGVDAAIESLEMERRAARVQMDLEKGEDIDMQIRRLDRHRLTIERQAEQQAAQQVARYNQAFDAAESQAQELYEFARNADSPGAIRMREIEQELKLTGSPLYESPDKPLKIAHMVAAELNIAPRSKKAATAAPKPVAPPAPKKQVLPGGSTVPVATNTTESARIAKIQAAVTPYAIRNLARDILAGKV